MTKGGDVMLFNNLIKTDTTGKHRTAWTSSMMGEKIATQCYRKRACTSLYTGEDARLCVPHCYFPDLCKSENCNQKKVQNSDCDWRYPKWLNFIKY